MDAMGNPKPRACMSLDELVLGMEIRHPYEVIDADLRAFAQLSGDWNPAHFDDAYAQKTVFKGRIAHGMISVAKLSGLFGMYAPGVGAIWGAQTVKFLAPVRLDTPYVAVARLKAKEGKAAIFETWVEDADGERVLEGEGTLYPIPKKVKDAMAPAELAALLA
jgi:3-hydroxybutyryl-CoA dehydratase